MNKVVLIGCGNVGMSYAYSLVTGSTKVDELALIDINQQKAEGEALDLLHASAYASNKMKIYAGKYSDCNNATIICICAGRNQEPGESRSDLLQKNYNVFKSIISEVNKTKFKGIYIVATNPLDVMTYITYKLSGFAPSKIIGSGTTLDTARLRCLISDELDISKKNIHAYVVGEHGDSEFVAWSSGLVGVNKLENYLNDNQKAKILYDVRTSAYEIINKKGNTSYGIGMCLLRITEAILDNDNAIMTISAYDKVNDIYIGMPSIINKNGVKKTLPVILNQDEKDNLEKSVYAIKKNIKLLKLE